MKNRFVYLVRISLFSIVLCGIITCTIWYPMITKLIDFNSNIISINYSIKKLFACISYYLCSIPCFYIVYIFWQISRNMKEDKLFSLRTYRLMKLSSNILIIDLIIFSILSIVFSIITLNFVNLLNLIFVIIGFILVIMLEVASYYLYKAYDLQQEVDLFI